MGASAKRAFFTVDINLAESEDLEKLPQETLYDRIIYIRKKLNLNSKQFAAKCGISESILQQWKRGIRNPHPCTILKISKTTGYPMSYILDADNIPEDTPAEIIYKYRSLSGLTQQQLASLAGLDRSTLQDYENAINKYTNSETLSKIYALIGYQNKDK